MTDDKYGKPFKDYLAEKLKDPEFKAEYERQEVEYQVVKAMVGAKIKSGLSQKEIAEKMGTTQSSISRALSGDINPSYEFLQRFAKAIGMNLEIRFY